jgi:hypothetical protein
VSKQLSQLVEQIGVEPAGLRGTVDALTVGAQATGAEVFVWDAGARALWSPVWGFDVVLSGAETRAMIESCRIRGVRRVADASSPACGLPAAIAQRGGARALAFAPMCSAGEFFGVVLRRYGSVAELERAEDEVLLASIAALGAVAIGKAAIVDREHERARDNELLLRSMHAASETRQRDRLTDYIQQAVEAVRTSRGVMFALDAGRLKLVGHSGIERLVVASAGSLRLGSTLVEELQRSGVTPIGCRVSQLDEPTSIVLSRLGFGENITAQLLRDTAGIVGVVVLDADYEALDLNAQTLVAAIGRQASLAVERQRMLRSIRKRSRHLACTPKLARSLTTGHRDWR